MVHRRKKSGALRCEIRDGEMRETESRAATADARPRAWSVELREEAVKLYTIQHTHPTAAHIMTTSHMKSHERNPYKLSTTESEKSLLEYNV